MVAGRLYNVEQTLFVVATEEVAGHFQAATESVKVAEVLHASPDGLSAEDLVKRITDAAKKHNLYRDSVVTERLGTALAHGSASKDLSKIQSAAIEGRIDTLLLGTDSSNTEHLNDVVRLTILGGGKVRKLASFDDPQAAIFRY